MLLVGLVGPLGRTRCAASLISREQVRAQVLPVGLLGLLGLLGRTGCAASLISREQVRAQVAVPGGGGGGGRDGCGRSGGHG